MKKKQYERSPSYIACKRVCNARLSDKLRKGSYVAINPKREKDRDQPLVGFINKSAKNEHSIRNGDVQCTLCDTAYLAPDVISAYANP